MVIDKQEKIDSLKPGVPPIFVLAFGILAISTASLFIRYAQQTAPSLVIAAYRLAIATLVLSVPALLRRREEIRSIQGKRLGLVVLSGIFLGFHFATWITSLEYTSVASSVVLVTTAPLWVALLSPLFLHERLSKFALVGLLVALAGGVIVGLSQGCSLENGLSCPSLGGFFQGRAFLGNLLALAGALFAAFYVMIGRSVRANLSLTTYTFTVYGIAALTLLIMVGVSGKSMLGYPPVSYVWFAALALVPQLLGHSSLNWALRYLKAAYVSVAQLGEPVGSVILAYLIMGESPNALELSGGILILTGIFFATRAEKKETK